MITTWLLGLFLAATAVQLFFWLSIFSRLAFYRQPTPPDEAQLPVSVIICARNEAENLRKNLRHFLTQKYRSFEVIVVNDHSTDKTREVVLDFQTKFPNLHLVDCTGEWSGKKAALTAGIEAARFDLIATSDADCYPATDQWLNFLQRQLRGSIQIGLGYSPYEMQSGFLNRFIRFETVYTAIQYLSLALTGLPYMGVGRNLIYRKDLFYQAGGFYKHIHIASGDDDLLVNAIANNTNTTIILNSEAFVFSQPKGSWRGYYYQKSRHLTTATSYRKSHQALLGLLAFSHAGHYLAALFLLASGELIFTALFIYLVRIGVVSWIYRRILHQLQDITLLRWIPLLDACYILYYFTFLPALVNGKKIPWK